MGHKQETVDVMSEDGTFLSDPALKRSRADGSASETEQ
jgi:hypothetical protein